MNKLEEKCALLARTPQVRWYDLRYKPTIQMLLNMNEEGTISLRQMNVPVFQMMNIIVYAFKYDGEFYFLFINQIRRSCIQTQVYLFISLVFFLLGFFSSLD